MYYEQQINRTPKGVYLPILKLHILNFNRVNLHAHTNFGLVRAFPFFCNLSLEFL